MPNNRLVFEEEIMKPQKSILVLKVGTSSLTIKDHNGYEHLDPHAFQRISKQILRLREQGTSVVIVSSAAITAGMAKASQNKRPDRNTQMHELQRLASIGWRYVMNEWAVALEPATIGELLLTRAELELERERIEALRVIHALTFHGDIAIINENDAIVHEEIAFGDNDVLAAILAVKMNQSSLFTGIKLVILSDVDGVYADANNPASIIPAISTIKKYEHLAEGTTNSNGTGGMITKFAAARIATTNGVDMWIANGRKDDVILGALGKHTGTHFYSHTDNNPLT